MKTASAPQAIRGQRAVAALAALLAWGWVVGSLTAVGAEGASPPSATSPVFSPDGQTVAFVLQGEAATEVAVVASPGGQPRALVSFAGEARLMGWFPDGQSVLVVDGEKPPGIWQVAVNASGKRLLAHGGSPRLSPDGKTLAFFADGRLQLLDLASGQTSDTGPASAEGWRMGDWLDAENLLALTGDGTLLLVSRPAPRNSQVVVPHQQMINSFIAVAVNARRRLLALTSDDMQLANPESQTSIWIYAWEGKQVGSPIPNAAGPAWSGAGRLFFARRGAALYLTDDFQTLKPIGKAETWAVSPDGSVVVVSRRDTDTNGDGAVNWLDASRLYRIAIHEGTPPTESQPLLASKENAASAALSLQKENPLLGVRFASPPSGLGAEFGSRTAICRPTARPPKLDGVLDDPCWAVADKITGFDVSTQAGTLARHQTLLLTAYDDCYLYVAFRCEHPNARAIKCLFGPRDRDGLVFRDDSVEMFFDTEHSHQRYYQVIVTAGGAIFDDRGQEVVSEYVDRGADTPSLAEKADYKVDESWNCGAEFVPGREDNAWLVEGRIPLADLGIRDLKAGAVWGFNTCRDEKVSLAQSLWAPSPVACFHVPRYFGHLVFEQPVLTLSEVSWGLGYGQCRLSLKVKLEGAAPKRVALRLSLVSDDKQEQLASLTRGLAPGQPTPLHLPYALPAGINSGKLVLSAGLDGKQICSRAHYFSLSPPLELVMRRDLLSTAGNSLDAVAWVRYGAATLADSRLVVQARNLTTGKLYRSELPRVGGSLATISLNPKILGEGKGVVEVSLVGKGGRQLGRASAPYEIIADPFTE